MGKGTADQPHIAPLPALMEANEEMSYYTGSKHITKMSYCIRS